MSCFLLSRFAHAKNHAMRLPLCGCCPPCFADAAALSVQQLLRRSRGLALTALRHLPSDAGSIYGRPLTHAQGCFSRFPPTDRSFIPLQGISFAVGIKFNCGMFLLKIWVFFVLF